MTQRCIALLGRRDEPIDAVEEYCRFLGAALPAYGIELEIARVAWAETGWRSALQELNTLVAQNRNSWFLLQYTALAWSRRGFSWRVLSVIRAIRKSKARCAMVFHDAETYFGSRLIDRLRRSVQLYTMREAVRLADLSILTAPPDKVPWLDGLPQRTVFIPVGANLPSPERAWQYEKASTTTPTVGVFSLSEGQVGASEVNLVADAVSHVTEKLGLLRLLILGRNSDVARPILEEKLRGKRIELSIRGVLPADEVVQLLGSCDAMLFPRGPIANRRGSAVAGIACGLPVVGREGWETAPPITEAGVALIPSDATQEFGPALVRVLADPEYRASLAGRSREAQRKYFSWEAIAKAYANALSARAKTG
jgi:glycosyltransferase involved in cell wall biosynthesis